MKLSFLLYEPVSDLAELDRRMARVAGLGYEGIELTASHPLPYPMGEVVALGDRWDADDGVLRADAAKLKQSAHGVGDVLDDADAEHDVERPDPARKVGLHHVPAHEVDSIPADCVRGLELGRRRRAGSRAG